MAVLLNERYRLLHPLGRGGFGETFLAEDTYIPSQRRCVIKQLKPLVKDPQIHQLIRDRFQREAAILEDLGANHDQIPDLYAYFCEAEEFYLVQEWVEGETLSQRVKNQGIFTEAQVRDLLLKILPILAFIHDRGIIHRDIKPDNLILRNRDRAPVLIDFGAVRETLATQINSQGNITSSIAIGTPGFMPSEQAAGRPIFSSDLYSLGLTAVYLLTGKAPQQLKTDAYTGEILWKEAVTGLSAEFMAILDKAVQSHPRDRYPTAQAMLEALEPALTVPPTAEPTRLTTPQPPTPEAALDATQVMPSRIKPWQSRKNWIFGGVLGIAIAATAIGTFFVSRDRTPQTLPNPSARISPLNPSPASSPTPSPVVSPSPSPTPPPPSPVASPTPPPPAVETLPTPTPSPENPDPPSIPSGIPESPNVGSSYGWLSQRRVTERDLLGKNAVQLSIMRNSVFARKGRKFNNSELQRYFNSQPWYNPRYAPDEFTADLLTPLEAQNAAFILEYQNQNGLRWLP